MSRVKNDTWINLGILIVSAVTLLGAFWVYCENHFASADVVNQEIDARKELKGEVDSLYIHLIPEPERMPLHHKEDLGKTPAQ